MNLCLNPDAFLREQRRQKLIELAGQFGSVANLSTPASEAPSTRNSLGTETEHLLPVPPAAVTGCKQKTRGKPFGVPTM
jgi:hypothetical protein